MLPDWINYLLQLKYLGVFLISLIGTASIIIPIPYTFIILLLSITPGWDPLFLTIAGALGSAIGEFSGYLIGYYGRSVISEERQRKMNYMIKIFNRYGPIAIFLFALTPLPDDLLFIPLGILRYKFIKAFIPCILGKTAMVAILAYGGQRFGDILNLLFGESTPEMKLLISIITSITLVLILVAMLKIDWEKVFEKYTGEKE